jgi:hypothetical protein
MVLMLVAVLLCGVLGGCASFYAKGDTAALIDAQAQTATTNLPRATAGAIPDAEAVNILTTTASTFATYDAAKTTNPFAYLIGKSTILVNAEYATRLDTDAQLAVKTLSDATGQPTAWLNAAVAREAQVLLDVKGAKDGVAPK